METYETKPKISLLICTYNRAKILPKAIESILRQTYKNFELVIVNNGSTDDTAEVLKQYQNNVKIRIFTLESNRGSSGGYNYGLDQLRGEWFGTLTDDDVLMDNAFELLISVPERMDSGINAITANCLLKSNGAFSGKGLDRDQYLDIETIITKCSGDFWGLTKLELLGDLRFNEHLIGNENSLWYIIDSVAKRYYLHQAVRTFNDIGETLTNQYKRKNVQRNAQVYQALLKEERYWGLLKKFHNQKYMKRCLRGWLFLTLVSEQEAATKYREMLKQSEPNLKFRFIQSLLSTMNNKTLRFLYRLWPRKFHFF